MISRAARKALREKRASRNTLHSLRTDPYYLGDEAWHFGAPEMADESYWTWKASTPTPMFEALPAGCFKGTEQQFYSLTPGMRREILRDHQRREKTKYADLVMSKFEDAEHADRREQRNRAAEVNAKARERL